MLRWLLPCRRPGSGAGLPARRGRGAQSGAAAGAVGSGPARRRRLDGARLRLAAVLPGAPPSPLVAAIVFPMMQTFRLLRLAKGREDDA